MQEEIDARWPRLLPGLAATPGIGFVGVLSREHGPLAIGADGYRRLSDGVVYGEDPMAPYAAHAASVLLRAMEMPPAPDIYVNSTVDPATLEVCAFEGLVGSHGGLGGWQDRGLLIAPTALRDPGGPDIRGAEELHRVLVAMLVKAGQRRELPRRTG